MKYFCKHHTDHELVKSKENQTDKVFICTLCKKNKEPGRDGIYHESDLQKSKLRICLDKDREETKGYQVNIWDYLGEDKPALKDPLSTKNIYDDPAYDEYDGF